MNKLSSFFEDNSGGLSSSRLVLILWAVGILSVWGYASVKAATLAPIPESVITMFGLSAGLKTVQRFGEKAEKSE